MESHHYNKDTFLLSVDEEGKAQLLETARWTKFIAIVGFVFLGLLLLLGLFAGFGVSALGDVYVEAAMGAGFGVGMMMVYLLMGLLYFFPIFYLYKYATLIKPAIQHSNQEQFNLALSYQRRMFKFIGIMFLVILGLYAVLILAGIAGAALAG